MHCFLPCKAFVSRKTLRNKHPLCLKESSWKTLSAGVLSSKRKRDVEAVTRGIAVRSRGIGRIGRERHVARYRRCHSRVATKCRGTRSLFSKCQLWWCLKMIPPMALVRPFRSGPLVRRGYTRSTSWTCGPDNPIANLEFRIVTMPRKPRLLSIVCHWENGGLSSTHGGLYS